MIAEPLSIAVVGHTNHGKTSLVRTLTWTRDFGEVADRRAVTRRVEWIDIADEDDAPLLRLYDTPGLENSIELRDAIEATRQATRDEGRELIERFLASSAVTRFPQPTKALRQMLECDVLLNVVDARQRTLAKYRDELEILRWANPRIVNVLNFTAHANARTEEWRDLLMRGGFGYVASFDVVALRPADERHLLDTIARLVAQTTGEQAIKRFSQLRVDQWEHFTKRALVEIAEMMIDVASHTVLIPRDSGDSGVDRVTAEMMAAICAREQEAYQRILSVRGMDDDDQRRVDLDLPREGWRSDPFDRSQLLVLAKVGGGGAAAGAMAGAVFDVAAAGLTFGIGTATGAVIGGLAGAARTHGRALRNRINAVREVAVSPLVVLHLAQRQVQLVDRLLHRGHAAQQPLVINDEDGQPDTAQHRNLSFDRDAMCRLDRLAKAVRGRARWSSLESSVQQPVEPDEPRDSAERPGVSRLDDPARSRLRGRLVQVLIEIVQPSADADT